MEPESEGKEGGNNFSVEVVALSNCNAGEVSRLVAIARQAVQKKSSPIHVAQCTLSARLSLAKTSFVKIAVGILASAHAILRGATLSRGATQNQSTTIIDIIAPLPVDPLLLTNNFFFLQTKRWVFPFVSAHLSAEPVVALVPAPLFAEHELPLAVKLAVQHPSCVPQTSLELALCLSCSGMISKRYGSTLVRRSRGIRGRRGYLLLQPGVPGGGNT